jgi:hypothetical protein
MELFPVACSVFKLSATEKYFKIDLLQQTPTMHWIYFYAWCFNYQRNLFSEMNGDRKEIVWPGPMPNI